MANAYLTVFLPGSQLTPVSVPFLYDATLLSQPLTLVRTLSLAQTINALQGSTWMFIGLEIRARVLRNFFAIDPPLPERQGFGMIDLRAPGQNTQPIHPILSETGPIKVLRIGVSVCQRQVATL